LTDTAGTITDTYFYNAFGEELAKTGTTENEFRYVGEQWDPNAGFYYLRARWYDQSTGRFASVDPYAGDPQAPVSLHRYLYANVSPVSFRDPSGYTTLVELNSASEIQTTLINISQTVNKIMTVYNKAQTAIELFKSLLHIVSVINGNMSDIKSSFPKGIDLDWVDEIPEAWADLMARGTAVGISDWGMGYVKMLSKGRDITAFTIYMPTIISMPGKLVPSGLKVNFKGKKIPVNLGFGGSGTGSLFGIGVVMGGEIDLLRMDLAAFRETHGGVDGLKGDEIAVKHHNRFHMHVKKWML
jgi:RHS repeat-associated protein